jgi:hypothetical protein
MKHTTITLVATCVLLGFLSANGQGNLFQNLDFELANPGQTVESPNGYPVAYNVPVANALPYWNVNYGDVQQNTVNLNSPGLGSTLVTLVGEGWPAIDGNYSVLLQGGETASAASITQSGKIPSGTESLYFEAQPGGGSLDVLIGTQVVSFGAVGTGANYTLYGANISAWAGDTEQLIFSALEDFSGPNNWELDDIAFSTTAVAPEPGTLALMLMGGVVFGARRWCAIGS